MIRTNRILDTKSVELGLSEPTPNLRLIDLVGIIQTTIDGDDVLDEYIHGHGVLLVLLVDRKCLFVQAVFGGDLGNFTSIVVLELVDVANDLALISADCGQEEQILQVLVVAEGGGLNDDLLQKFDELNREICLQEGPDGDRNIVGICALGKGSGDELELK